MMDFRVSRRMVHGEKQIAVFVDDDVIANFYGDYGWFAYNGFIDAAARNLILYFAYPLQKGYK